MRDDSSTYVVQERKYKKDELTRLTIQDQILTTAMGGVLAEQTDPTVFRHVLDIACGTGGWLIKAAQTYPTIEKLVGIDISQQMIKYSQTQAEADQLNERVEFHVMDALQTLDFPAASFDLVNLRLGQSFLRTWDWPKVLAGLHQIIHPGGVIRITESEVAIQSNSPALTRLFKDLQCALFRASRLFEEESAGLTNHLPRLLNQCGYKAVQKKAHAMEYRAGTPEGEAHYEDVKLAFQTLRPFIEKRGCASQDYGATYRRALNEMRQPDFCATWNILTAWGNKA